VDCKHFVLFNFLLSKDIGCPYCINIAPITKPYASHLMIKGLEKSGVANTGVVDIMFFGFFKKILCFQIPLEGVFLKDIF
jgi:hypothetical protein